MGSRCRRVPAPPRTGRRRGSARRRRCPRRSPSGRVVELVALSGPQPHRRVRRATAEQRVQLRGLLRVDLPRGTEHLRGDPRLDAGADVGLRGVGGLGQGVVGQQAVVDHDQGDPEGRHGGDADQGERGRERVTAHAPPPVASRVADAGDVLDVLGSARRGSCFRKIRPGRPGPGPTRPARRGTPRPRCPAARSAPPRRPGRRTRGSARRRRPGAARPAPHPPGRHRRAPRQSTGEVVVAEPVPGRARLDPGQVDPAHRELGEDLQQRAGVVVVDVGHQRGLVRPGRQRRRARPADQHEPGHRAGVVPMPSASTSPGSARRPSARTSPRRTARLPSATAAAAAAVEAARPSRPAAGARPASAGTAPARAGASRRCGPARGYPGPGQQREADRQQHLAQTISGSPLASSSRVAGTPPSTEFSIGTIAAPACPRRTASSAAPTVACACSGRSPTSGERAQRRSR